MNNKELYEKPKNSCLGYIMPLLMSLLYSIVLGAVQSQISYQLFFLAFLSSYIIGMYMLKYLEYFTTFHKMLAAIYGLLAYVIFLISYIFFLYLSSGAGLIESFRGVFSVNGFKTFLALISGFNVIYIIITPIASYCYLEYRGRH